MSLLFHFFFFFSLEKKKKKNYSMSEKGKNVKIS